MIKTSSKIDINPYTIYVPRFLEFPVICQACCNRYRCLMKSEGRVYHGLCPPMVMNVQCHFGQVFFHMNLDPPDDRIRYLDHDTKNGNTDQEAYLSTLYIDKKPYRVVIGHQCARDMWLILQLSPLQKHEAGELLALSKDVPGRDDEPTALPWGLSMHGIYVKGTQPFT